MPDVRAPSVPTDEHARLAVDTFRMLADPTRLKVLWILLQGEAHVSALCQHTGASAPAVSQHLAKLRLAGLVSSRREGTFVYYSAASAHVRRLLTEALSHAEHVGGEVTGADPHTYDA
ncbi:ArsR/SmtB family transcription factor [Ornithinimicrobium pekingense]|uniref:Transcriptional regulator n=1 Tax=Ornithinimicrobium pekingense TaxID=384677 RepID=A0ABQ2FBG5_9MICO|nr:metalloregulator ArsR/SmtB family transcription factor [Ornithinimicrobium pekingense]GGK77394.1 transcriptional regulator [Ornithinimicrobium pekingense]